jgi:hypothetical protein
MVWHSHQLPANRHQEKEHLPDNVSSKDTAGLGVDAFRDAI